MRVRCPNCHNSTEVDADTQLSNIACTSCGREFSLVNDETLTYTEAETKTIGHFRLVDQIGSGAFGAVWLTTINMTVIGWKTQATGSYSRCKHLSKKTIHKRNWI